MGYNATKLSKFIFLFAIILLFTIVSVFTPRAQASEVIIVPSSSIGDSIKKYKTISPNKAIEFCFEVFNKNKGAMSLPLVNAQFDLGDILFSKGLKLEALEYYNSANINYYLIPI